jgi:hypothetical protein
LRRSETGRRFALLFRAPATTFDLVNVIKGPAMTSEDHWNKVYDARTETALTWFEDAPLRSCASVTTGLAPGDPVIDIGSGASRLVDHLLAAGFGPITVLDLSRSALALSRQRLGPAADQVTWINADITTWTPDRIYRVWHDRAVFHFLTEAAQRAAYVEKLLAATRPGSTVVISTFDLTGPEKCSSLPIIRYSPETLAHELQRLAPGQFVMTDAERFDHTTPLGRVQQFQQSRFRRD